MTDNISVSESLINSSIYTVKYLYMRLQSLFNTMHVKFDDANVCNVWKGRRLHGELKKCVPITARKKGFF